MLRINNYLKIVPKKHFNMPPLHRTLTSHDIRQQFLDYFIKSNDHSFIRSSPVVPYGDPSLTFVNSGMHQFKDVFLGKRSAPCLRAVSSQKCVRVGRKQNDSAVVGTNSYHHTFFEMLGNWSFGDYFKKEACELAWNLLKGPYQINTSRLYVTYFGGNGRLQLPPDYECRDIWRRLGISEDRILPFGMEENFWVMGNSGPCGPSTEIYIDRIPNNRPENRASRANSGLPDLIQLWNIVFIEHNLNENGSIQSLPTKHINTGMGMERLVAVLQGKSSNYETDLFRPIIDKIQKVTKAPNYVDCYNPHDPSYKIDSAYRTLADHTRMITACLADEMIPEQNQKLRRVLRKALLLSSKTFGSENLLYETVPVVIDILGDTYPEMQRNYLRIQQIIKHEDEVLNSLRKNNSSKLAKILEENPRLDGDDFLEYDGFVPAFNEIRSRCHGKSIISGDLMYKLYAKYGIDEEIMGKIAENECLRLDRKGFTEHLANRKQLTKSQLHYFSEESSKIVQSLSRAESTDSAWKYSYEYNEKIKEFVVPNIEAKIIAIENRENDEFDVVLDKTNFCHKSGGQASDVGQIFNKNGVFSVENVISIDGVVIHRGIFLDGKFELNRSVELAVNGSERSRNMRNHTATHLLYASVKKVTKSVTYQKSSSVMPSELRLDLGILGYKQDCSSINEIEKLVRNIIQSSVPVTTSITDSHGLNNLDGITFVPDTVSSDSNLRIISVTNEGSDFACKEVCCGTHVLNTAQLEDFCITNVKASGRRSFIFTAITGPKATQAHLNVKDMLTNIVRLKSDFDEHPDQNKSNFESKIQEIRELLNENINFQLPHVVKTECLHILEDISKDIKDKSKTLKDFIDFEMKNVLQNSPKESHPFIVHFLQCTTLMESARLPKATRFCTDRPIIVLSLTGDYIKAICCVPSNYVTEKFSALIWLTTVADVFDTQIQRTLRGQNRHLVCEMKSKKLSFLFDEKLETAMQQATDFAKNNM